MIRYIYWAYWKYRSEFRNDTGIMDFGGACLGQMVAKSKGDLSKLDEQITINEEKTTDLREQIDRREARPQLEPDEFPKVRSSMILYNGLFFILVVSEFGLNYFTTFLALDASKAGIFWTGIRIGLAAAITFLAIIGIDFTFKYLFPEQALHYMGRGAKKAEAQPKRDMPKIIISSMLFLIAEFVIYFFGLSRAHTFEGAGVGSEMAVAMVALSMVIPVAAGILWWKRSEELGAYRNTIQLVKLRKQAVGVTTATALLEAKRENVLKEHAIGFWNRFNLFKGYKKHFNRVKKKLAIVEVVDGHPNGRFLVDFNSFETEGNRQFEIKRPVDATIADSLHNWRKGAKA